jgi:hypothetical protein
MGERRKRWRRKYKMWVGGEGVGGEGMVRAV